ncbi:MAP7 domain-containing protein 2-like isoform X2 [Sinocyclocheilus grahami]|uniref:MAP7 domain-containing protein 2-like isoform X2 n=1 Tax=Sinocyclocheilus grahami TaxID=75366 RepID=UPI0007AD4AED|nr:PREDICTED: MAP7 domain-containing protein 2-like isoform X2 [Sinocyclocheilus grahami]
MAENAVNTAASTPTVTKVMTSPLTPEKRPQSNGHASPIYQKTNQDSPSIKHTDALTPPTVTEKKTQTNGHASPSRHPANTNSHAGKQYMEGYLKTDDRMRLAKERREERERGLAAREQAIKEKERRAQLQYEKTVEERWKRLEEQRQKEELRRAAVEEKRRQQLEEEKERLEALMRRSLERSLQLENRNKRWAWGPNGTAQGDWENAPPSLSAASAHPHDLAAPSPAAIESGNAHHGHLNSMDKLKVNRLVTHTHSSLAHCNSAAELHLSCLRCKVPSSPHRGSPSRRRNNHVPTEESSGTLSAPNTPKKERLRRERRTGSPATGSPVRRAKSPADVTRRSASPATPKLLPKSRTQSPCTVRQYPPSPMKHRPATPVSDSNRKTEDKQAEIVKSEDPKVGRSLKAEIHQNKSPNNESLDKAPKMETTVSSTPPPERRTIKIENHINGSKEKKSVVLENQQKKNEKLETPEKKHPITNCNDVTANKCADPSPVNSPGRVVAGTTDAEEASRLLAERRRLARVLKEQEEKQRRELEEQEKLKSERLKKRQLEERARQEEKARQAEEEKCRHEQERKKREQEEKKHKEKELQAQMEKEKEEAEIRAQKDAERQRQKREIFKQQEEQERQQRKKRIEEIMKRTRKGDGEMKREDSPEPLSPVSHPISPPGGNHLTSSSEVKSQANPIQTTSVHGQIDKQESPGKRPENGCSNEQMKSPAHMPAKNPFLNGQVNINSTAVKTEEKGKVSEENAKTIRQESKQVKTQSLQVKEQIKREDTSAAKVQVNPLKSSPENTVANIKSIVMTDSKPQVYTQVKVPTNIPTHNLQENYLANGKCQTITQVAKQEASNQVKTADPVQMNGQATAQGPRKDITGKKSDIPHANAQRSSTVTVPQAKTFTQAGRHTITQVKSKEGGNDNLPSSFTSLQESKPPLPLIRLDTLEGKSGAAEDSADEVQYMEVSPVSREELISIPEFSPVNSPQQNGMNNMCALEDLLDLTGQVAYPRLSPAASLGDCNKNLIEGVCSPGSDSKLIPPSSDKHHVQ